MLVGAAGVVVAGLVWWFLHDPNPPVERGGRDYHDVRGSNFPGRGELIRDQHLLEQAADAWRADDDNLAPEMYAVWAGRTEESQVVILQNRGSFEAVQVDGERTALGRAQMNGDRFVVSQAGILVARGLSSRWIASRLGGDGLADVARLEAVDGLVSIAVDDALLAFMPVRQPADGAVPALIGGRQRPVEVDPGDWPRFRDALADTLSAPLASAAVDAALGQISGSSIVEHARVLHTGVVPGDDIGAAASASPADTTIIAFASGPPKRPIVDLLGVAPRGRTALAARRLRRDPESPWLVVAGSPNISSLQIDGSTRKGNFALEAPSLARPSEVRGKLPSGREIRPVGP